jgi:hypothetical protein
MADKTAIHSKKYKPMEHLKPMDMPNYEPKNPMFGGTGTGAFEKTLVDVPKSAKKMVTHSPTMLQIDMSQIHTSEEI